MATQLRASSSLSSVPFSTRSYTHHVFLSFRGEDTRYNFTGHLHRNLVQRGINTFIDDDDLPRGEEISEALVRAIEGSKLSLIVFSENYASSKWCLEELVHILECRRSKNQMVRPIFYKVDPSDVRHQRGTFSEALAEHERRFEDGKNKVSRWRAALLEAANLSGWHFSSGHESKFIDIIVEEVSTQLKDRINLDVAQCPVGIDSRLQDMLEIVDVRGGDHIRMVGIWGSGGIGKTTIAKAVYNTVAHEFDGSCFLANVREGSKQHGGLVNLQNIILSKILGGKELKVINVDEGNTLLRERLRYKRILLVLDDVDQLDQLEKLAGAPDWFGRGSRVIITTRDKQLLIAHQVNKNKIYEARRLNHDEACELFCANALMTDRNMDYDEKHAVNTIINYAEGLPLALKVLGSHLCSRSIDQWQALLDGHRRSPLQGIHKILKISYDALEQQEREIFLDIACFFKNKNKNDVIAILEGCGYSNPMSSIEVLGEKALLNVEHAHIFMHDLLEEMGKKIVHNESPKEPGRRSRLWYHSDVRQVLTENTSMENLKSLNLSGCKFLAQSPDLSGSPNLEFLDLSNCKSLKKVHPSVGSLKKLVDLNLESCSNLVRLPGEVNWRSLRSINLNDCTRLESFPEIEGEMKCMTSLYLYNTGIKALPSSIGYLINLQSLVLDHCGNLTDLPCSIYELQKLKTVLLSECPKLVRFPNKVESEVLPTYSKVSHDNRDSSSEPEPDTEFNLALPCLDQFLAGGCNLSNIDFLGSLDCASTLDLSESTIVILPECIINKFVNLRQLNLIGCTRLVEIPGLPPRIRLLNVMDCVSLERISKLSNILERKESQMIKEMDLTNCWRLCQNLVEMANKDDDDEVHADLISRLLSSQQSKFTITFPVPRSEVPKWFSCQMDFMGHRRFEFYIETLANFKWDNAGLALCVAVDQNLQDAWTDFTVYIHINEVRVSFPFSDCVDSAESDHVWLHYVPFLEMWPVGYMRPLPPFTCRVIIYQWQKSESSIKSCGVHLVMPPNEDVSMKLIRAENLTSELSEDELQKDFWDNYRPKQRTDCKELYTDAQLENEKL
ncbi:disease resistance protein RPV1 isoform X2 [Rosa chinensis]|uniref:disease resistance protein RPV1 isoform X2 n=1 Tax=Rosa chinensis TaxID=74649 RepID=UPI000D092798|nr:disease resistance protein RPV1 isoform X2 [Rosa chinensis]